MELNLTDASPTEVAKPPSLMVRSNFLKGHCSWCHVCFLFRVISFKCDRALLLVHEWDVRGVLIGLLCGFIHLKEIVAAISFHYE